jgi:hypothetical protein
MRLSIVTDRQLRKRGIDAFEWIHRTLTGTSTIGDYLFTFNQSVESGACTVIAELIDGWYLNLIFLPRKLSQLELEQLGNQPRAHAHRRYFHADTVLCPEHHGQFIWAEGGRGREWHSPEEIVGMIMGTTRVRLSCPVCEGSSWFSSTAMKLEDCPHCEGKEYEPFEWETRCDDDPDDVPF